MLTAEPTPETAAPEASPAPARTCANCGGGMERHQDWCLECGTAAPGRLGALRPGWRAVTTTLALTLVLVGGAGAASYAALSSDANRDALTASVPVDGTPVAQAPPAVPAPAAPVAPGATAVTPPAAKLPTAPKATPVPPAAPATTQTTAQVAPSVTTPKRTPSASDSVPRSTSTAAGPRGAGTSADGSTGSSSATLTPIALGTGALSVYDPYKRSVAPGDPAEGDDGDDGTTFEVGAPNDSRGLEVGIVVDLGSAKQVRGLQVTTTTPGGTIEVYATDSSALPPDILDTRWDHPASRKAVARSEHIVFPRGGSHYRYVTLWLTKAPTTGRRFGLTELKVLK